MTGKELVALLRNSYLDDVKLPYLWEDPELLWFLNEAEDEACRRANLIIDDSTSNDSGTAGTASTAGQQSLCVLTVRAYQAKYTLSEKILQIKRCQLSTMTAPLDGPVSYSELDEIMPCWMGTAGTILSNSYPCKFLNEPCNTITFVGAPSTNDTAYLVVSRLPLVKFTLDSSPEIGLKYHRQLCDWAAHLAFRKPDSDTLNLPLSKDYEAEFERNFGPLPTAKAERIMKTISQKQRMRARAFGS